MTKTTRTLSDPNNNLSTQLGSLANDDMNEVKSAAKINFRLTCAGCKYAKPELPVPKYAKRPHGVSEWAKPIQCTNPDSPIAGCWLNLIESTGNLVPRIVTDRCRLYEREK